MTSSFDTYLYVCLLFMASQTHVAVMLRVDSAT